MTLRLYRILAGVCDLLLFAGMCAVCAWLGWLKGTIFFFVAIAVWMELCWRVKGSPGKAMFNVGIEFTSRGQVYFRELIGKAVSACTFGVGFLMIFSSRERALHDYIANTDVVRSPKTHGLVDALRLAYAAFVVGAIVLLSVGNSKATQPIAPAPSTAAATAKWNVAKSENAVMTIHVYRDGQDYAQGSGFLIDNNGTAVTNVHVLGGGQRADVELGDGRKFQVTRVRAYDSAVDVAIFQIGTPTGDFPVLPIGSSQKVQVGDRVVVIGSPEGLANTVTDGVLSARRPPDNAGESSQMQVSAAISPGSSGGPVFDEFGNVIGVTESQLEEGQNLNFAIPIEEVTKLLAQPDLNLTQQAFYGRLPQSVRDGDESPSQSASDTPPAQTPAPHQATPSQPRTPPAPPHNRQPDNPRNNGSEVRGTFVH